MVRTLNRVTAHPLLRVEALARLLYSQIGFTLPSRLLLSRWVRGALRGWAGEKDFSRARRLADIAHSVERRYPSHVKCLQRSLLLAWMMRRQRLAGDLRIGVQKRGEEIVAHAWVEVAGRPVNDSSAHCSQFAVLETSQDVATHEPLWRAL